MEDDFRKVITSAQKRAQVYSLINEALTIQHMVSSGRAIGPVDRPDAVKLTDRIAGIFEA